MNRPSNDRNDFVDQSAEKQPGLLAEFADFLIHNKKWWLSPFFVVLLLLSLFVIATGSSVAPFIYSFF